MKRCCQYILLVLLASTAFLQTSSAQCDGNPGPDGLTWEYRSEEETSFSLGRFFGDIVRPRWVKDTRVVRSYVRDPRFARLRALCGDVRALDAIYLKAVVIAEYDIQRALFLSLAAVVQHRRVEMKMPVVGSVAVPLAMEDDTLFARRITNLPRRIYPDSPPNEDGDRDKLQHFFASAYLEFTSESSRLTEALGNIVESGEAQFVVGGANDPRDKRTNAQGAAFGKSLLSDKTALPSDFLSLGFQPILDRSSK